ncbi:substrate-binding domain-containing protein [Propionibacteriaceae bacterium Y1923]|uniref:LacI family DNA-binding transcriptional regulator n=1 Tax=Aestuariimicrobium sp. Y1814 TaxID=3418742 RepID=UPI003C131DDF
MESKPLKYQRLADDLRRDILASVWVQGAKLPTDDELQRERGVALSTVRRAYDVLVAEGLVERRQGAGTFVATRAAPGAGGSVTIGVLVPTTQLYYGQVMQGIEAQLSMGRAGLRFATYQYDSAEEDRRIADLLAAGVDALIVVPTLTTGDPRARIAALRALPVPVVLMERQPPRDDPGEASEFVCSDHAGGAFDAVQHLAGLGHRRIAMLGRGDAATCAGVRAGYRAALQQSAERLDGIEIVHANDEWPRRIDRALAELGEAGCTAALVFGDREATLLLHAAARAGLSVPGDLAVVSYDDEFADLAPVPLTAVAPPKHRLGQVAARLALQRLQEGDNGPLEQVLLRPRLVVRDSCGAISRIR